MASTGDPVGVGIIGAGNISDAYLKNLTRFPDLEVRVVGDLDVQRAASQAVKYEVPASGGPDEVLGHAGVEIVVNLTIPAAHAAVSSAIVGAGKHVWSEKPIAVDRESAKALLRQARDSGMQVGVAPDTLLGPGFQTARRVIERGDIGRPLFAHTSMQWQGPELFHPNPAFLFARGAGPIFDIGPYYLAALVHVFGPVAAVAALGIMATDTRQVQVGPFAGESFPVEVPSTISLLARFEQGQQSDSVMSFDSPLYRQGVFEISGTEGTIVLPDPNHFGGRVAVVHPLKDFSTDPDVEPDQPWIEVPNEGVLFGRGGGVVDLARAVRGGRPHVATGELGYHVLDVLVAIEESAARAQFVNVDSTVGPVGTLPADFDPFARTL